MASFVLSLSVPTNYVLVRGSVNRFNAKTGNAVDPISVAEALIQKGYNIVGIPQRKLVITPTDDGLVPDKAQILQIIADDQLGNYPIVEAAVQNMLMLCNTALPLKNELERIAKNIGALRFRSDSAEPQDARSVVSKYMLDRIMYFDISYSESKVFGPLRAATKEEQKRVAEKVVEQAMYIFDTIDTSEQLVTKTMKQRWEARKDEMAAEERDARARKRAELFASKESAERWLFGAARHAYREAGGNADAAASVFSTSGRARDLIAHHTIDLFDYVDRQIAALGAEHEQRKEMAWIEGPVSVILGAFAVPRSIVISPEVLRTNPGEALYRRLRFWLAAKFVSELPDGTYAEVVKTEDAYQARYREKTSDYIRRDSWGMRGSDELDDFFDDLDRKDDERNQEAMQKYERSRVAMLWWRCPLWLRLKLLKPGLRDEFVAIRAVVGGFSYEDFMGYFDSRIANENRMIKMQNALLKNIEPPDMKALEQYFKEQFAAGRSVDDLFNEGLDDKSEASIQSAERAEAMIKKCKEQIKHLEELRDFVHVYLVMTPPAREAAIARRQREREAQRDRFRMPFSIFSRR